MSRSSSPRAAWSVLVGLTMALTVAAVLVLPRVVGGSDLAAADDPAAPAAVRPVPTTTAPASPRATPPPTGPLRLLGFGDSVMAGAGCDCDDFLTRVGAGLHTRTSRKVITTNNGTNGETAAGLLRDLKTDGALQDEISQADVIVVTIGANDLGPALDSWQDDGCAQGCYQPEIDEMADRLTGIMTIVDAHKKTGVPVLVTNYWNVFEDGDVGAGNYGKGYLSWSDSVTRAANAAICRTAARSAATCVDTYAPFKADGSKDPTELLADDGDHPDDAGSGVIARAVLAAAEARLGG